MHTVGGIIKFCRKEIIQAHAEGRQESVNAFVIRAIDETI